MKEYTMERLGEAIGQLEEFCAHYRPVFRRYRKVNLAYVLEDLKQVRAELSAEAGAISAAMKNIHDEWFRRIKDGRPVGDMPAVFGLLADYHSKTINERAAADPEWARQVEERFNKSIEQLRRNEK